MDGTPADRKRRVELELDEELVARAERHAGNLPRVLEGLLRQHVAVEEARLERQSIDARSHAHATHALIDRHGLWGEEFSTL